ncbi:histone-like nucleoid-structuring protein Lsr2 [Streptomyces sp. NPDC060209]|uniref:Lsr2 family DNA-binding protein n=1 Tax=Streptomyces sp. NPDC060209 TaxID=3347073 RepID=UPI00366135FD
MTALTALTQLCPPPSQAMGIRWDTVESSLGRPLPQDYKELADRYGPGTFNDYLDVYHPHGVTEYVNLTGPMPGRIRAQLHEDAYPVPYDPETLFACGATYNGEYLFWITDPAADPDRWQIAVNEARGPRWFTYDGTLTDFLTAVLAGELQVPMFPPSILDAPARFVPHQPTLWKPAPYSGDDQPVDTGAIRTWARAHGYAVPSRGRIPPEIRAAWERDTAGS